MSQALIREDGGPKEDLHELFGKPREHLDDDTLMSDYKYFQWEVIRRGLDVLPGYMPLSVWRENRKDAWGNKSYCSREIPKGRLPGAVKIGTDWYVPVGARPKDPRETYEENDGIEL